MRIKRFWQNDQFLVGLFKLFRDAGFQLYFVGGCVRDCILQRFPSDLDLATDATPTKMKEMFNREKIGFKPIGIEFGSLMVGPNGVSITTFRKDTKAYGRKVEVCFATDLETDSSRRDFTINALYADYEGKVHDPRGGLKDLEKKRVRFIGNPVNRINEDYLRILRFFRFSALYGDSERGCDSEGLDAIRKFQAEKLELLSGYRIRSEIFRILSVRPLYWCLKEWENTPSWHWHFPEGQALKHEKLEQMEQAYQFEPNPITSLAVLNINTKNCKLDLTRVERLKLDILLQYSKDIECSLEELAYRFGKVTTEAIILIRAIVGNEGIPSDFRSRIDFAASQEFPVKAKDLGTRYEGKELGDKLKELQRVWISSGFEISKSALLKLV
ncbi:MAG: CCA tRNA nucleotidyltransferase [Paracoccaceae bacterium]|nr:CCA tRNA nucleotidyltransferase [Paracoccaceae bacterium]MDE2674325.1 CCA tRNA nucleotidyltransferase [Paracoccaceae bacterium]